MFAWIGIVLSGFLAADEPRIIPYPCPGEWCE